MDETFLAWDKSSLGGLNILQSVLFPSSALQSVQNKLILGPGWWKGAISFILIPHFTCEACGSLGLTCQRFHGMENEWIGKMVLGVVGFDGDWADFSVLFGLK